ncbi:MAG: Acidobacterial duplicated orphan permease [Cytophagales bacterium]|jgi:putative ABC transport system permease protein|nr:ABC transporter permease [Bacteroidota bacterium]MBS1981090.1 ABC transporter permease [Bacteroidota bacterium]WHZ08455.1 MAG: Acidobacterial duplicated orphan permease [Cytophagales bacterium]
MIRNYLKIAFRSLLKFKGYTLINLTGLSLGLMCGMVILLYVIDELSYDDFHQNKNRVYRVVTQFGGTGTENGGIETNGWPIGKILEKEYPEVEAVMYARNANLTVNYEGSRFRQNNIFVSAELFKIFSFQLKEGDPTTALAEPFTVVISEDMARKFFPGQDALNKTLVMADTLSFKITGVMENIPSNSHIQADMFLSFATYQRWNPDFSFEKGWGNFNVRNYILLKPNTDFKGFSAKAKNIYEEKVGEEMKKNGIVASLRFEPLTRIYLHSKAGNGMGPLGSMDRVYLLSGVSVLVILLACINFVNLSTARSVYRAKEVGLRKVVGSSRTSIVTQFLSESFLLTTIALFLALACTGLLLPFFNQLLGKQYSLNFIFQPAVLPAIGLLTVTVSFLSGYYPALIISKLKPAEMLKGKMKTGTRGVQLRRVLVVFQFLISVGLVSGTLIIIDQLDFMQKQNLGFNKDEVLVVKYRGASGVASVEAFKEQLKALSFVDQVTNANALPGTPGWQGQIAYAEGKSADAAIETEYVAVDENYIQTLDLQLIAGRGFNKDRLSELDNGLVLNETAVNEFGWANPQEAIGKTVESPSGTPAGTVIGVVKDYHQHGLQQKIAPVAMDYAPGYANLYAIRYKAANTQQLLSSVKELWSKNFPDREFNYYFLNDSFEKQYQSEKKLAQVFTVFASMAILIAVIGLLGLVSFMVVSRTKEIGIRKVLGADVLTITRLLTKEFIWLVILANFIAAPAIWYLANQWLQKFAYRMHLTPSVLVMVLLLAVVLTILTVSIQSIKAAMANPVESLKNE